MIYFWIFFQKDWGNPHCQNHLFIVRQKKKIKKAICGSLSSFAPGEQNLTQKAFSFLKFFPYDMIFVVIETLPT